MNNSFCDISSLEVYRGKEQATEISHEGFCLSDDGSIEVGDPKHIIYPVLVKDYQRVDACSLKCQDKPIQQMVRKLTS